MKLKIKTDRPIIIFGKLIKNNDTLNTDEIDKNIEEIKAKIKEKQADFEIIDETKGKEVDIQKELDEKINKKKKKED